MAFVGGGVAAVDGHRRGGKGAVEIADAVDRGLAIASGHQRRGIGGGGQIELARRAGVIGADQGGGGAGCSKLSATTTAIA
jgi:hypothetical protein